MDCSEVTRVQRLALGRERRGVVPGEEDALHASEGLPLDGRIWVDHEAHDQLLTAQLRHQAASCREKGGGIEGCVYAILEYDQGYS